MLSAGVQVGLGMEQKELFGLGVEGFFESLPVETRHRLQSVRRQMAGSHDTSSDWENMSEVFYSAAQIYPGKMDLYSTSSQEITEFEVSLEWGDGRSPQNLDCIGIACVLMQVYGAVIDHQDAAKNDQPAGDLATANRFTLKVVLPTPM